MFQSDLFERPAVPGLRFRESLLTPEAERDLIRRIDEVELTPFRFQGWTGKRLTASFGWRYDFDDASFGPTEPIPDWLLPVRQSAAAFADLPADQLVQALLIRYDPGAGIGWHRDRPVFEDVVGISLGVPAAMRFRRRRGGCERGGTVMRELFQLDVKGHRLWGTEGDGDHKGSFAHTTLFEDYQLVLGSKPVTMTRYQPMERKY